MSLRRAPDGTAFKLSGPAAAPAVALVHGLGLNHAVWQWLEPELSKYFRVLRYDIHGHGQSVTPEATPNLRNLSEQLAALMDHCAMASAAIVGFSLGGMVARRLTQDHPARVRALAILHSPHRRAAAAQSAILARVSEARKFGPAATVEAALLRWFTDECRAANPALMNLVRGWVLANDPKVYPDYYRILVDGIEEIVTPVPAITCPTLVITADQDFGNDPEMSRAIAAEILGSQTLILPGLRHMALAESPAAVNQPLLSFLHHVFARAGT